MYLGTGTPSIGNFYDSSGGPASIQLSVTKVSGEW